MIKKKKKNSVIKDSMTGIEVIKEVHFSEIARSRTKLYNMVVTSHNWLIKFKCKLK